MSFNNFDERNLNGVLHIITGDSDTVSQPCDFDLDLGRPPALTFVTGLFDPAFFPPTMAEVLGIASSITALIENTITVIKYLKDVKNAPKECDELQRELQYLEICLTALERTTQLSTEDDPWLRTLDRLQDMFKELLELLDGLKMKLKAGSSRLKKFLRRMDWTMTKESVMEDLGRIERFKSLILIAGQHDNIALTLAIQKTLGNIKDNVDVILENTGVILGNSNSARQFQMDEKAKEVASWLTPVDYNAVQRDKLQQRVDETGQWFLRSPEFLNWVDSPVAPSVLWCAGGPGVGKTMLASTTVDHLRMKFKVDEADKVLVFCIFCDYRTTDQKTVTIIRSLLKQLIQARRCLTAPIEAFYDKWSDDGMPSPSLAEITSLFSVELKSYDRIYIILDGLDELDDDRCREGVLDALKALGGQICVLVTSRPLDTMQSFTKAHKIEIQANNADLEKCVIAGLACGNLPTILSNDESLHEKICKTVVKKADGMFLLANIHMNLLAQCTNRRQLDTELDNLPGTLRNAYEYLLARIDSLPSKDLAYRVFGWVAFAAEPLEVVALQDALAIESGTKKADPANITDEGILLSICAGLIVTVDINNYRCFKFVHYSTQEYFISQEDKLFPHIHVDFTCICLAHMSFNPMFDSNKQIILFSWYSSHYWDFHACKCSGSSTAKAILAFLDDKPTQMEDIAQPFREQQVDIRDPTFFTDMVCAVKLLLGAPEVDFQHLHGLCLAAYVGNYNLVLNLRNNASAIDCEGQVPFLHEVPSTSLSPAQKDSSGCRGSCTPLCTPLIAAASNGHRILVGWILRSSEPTSLNAMSSSGLTALCSAIICNSIPVVMLLLQEDDIDTSIQFKGQTPFMLAARYGFTEIMELFLERQEDDPNALGENGRTALHAAIEESQHGSIDLLLKSGQVDVNRKDCEGRTALSFAARLGSIQSVKRLVDHVGIDISVKDNNGKSAYNIVVEGGQHEVVTLLAEYAVKGPGTE